jgi:hypothetical protein
MADGFDLVVVGAGIVGLAAALARHKPDFIIDTVADLIPVIDEIEARMERGEQP